MTERQISIHYRQALDRSAGNSTKQKTDSGLFVMM